MKCPKCKGEMEEGVIVDHSAAMGGRQESEWASRIKWGGLTADNSKQIQSYRCKNCGYLESYAK